MGKRPSWLRAREAAAFLDVKLATLYAYKSRGLVESVPSPKGRGRLYARESLERLKARHDARSGHGAVAASALRFGEPSLETSISEIRADGPYYRGHSAVALCAQGESFEAIFDLLLTGQLRAHPDWSHARDAVLLSEIEPPLSDSLRALCATRASGRSSPSRLRATPISAFLAALVGTTALADPERHGASDEQEHARARRLTCALAQLLGGDTTRRSGASVAERVLVSLGQKPGSAEIETLDRTLGLCADHELNASTFAARVTASTGADLYACLGTALHTLSGGRHGEASVRVEAVLREIAEPARAAEVLRERSARGERIPGFGHPLYAQGDPRASAMLQLAERAHKSRRTKASRDYARMLALIEAMQRAGHPRPNLDTGLVAVTSALGLGEGAGAAVFAIGRIPGWVAHILEQRRLPSVLRPRARYVPAAPPLNT